jgi:sorbose reductase
VLDQLKMHGKVCVVTGGSDGIGFAAAEAMAEAGADVVLWYNT